MQVSSCIITTVSVSVPCTCWLKGTLQRNNSQRNLKGFWSKMDLIGVIDDLGGLLSEVCKFCGDDIFCVTDPTVPEQDLAKGQNIFVYFALGTPEKSEQMEKFLKENDFLFLMADDVFFYRLINFSMLSLISLMFLFHVKSVKSGVCNFYTTLYTDYRFHDRGVEGQCCMLHAMLQGCTNIIPFALCQKVSKEIKICIIHYFEDIYFSCQRCQTFWTEYTYIQW